MVGYTKEVRRLLAEAGCHYEREGKGDHEIWYCPSVKRHVTVDGNIKSRHTANGTLTDAGLKKKF